MTFEDIVSTLKQNDFGNLRTGALNELYWIRDSAVPALLVRIGELDAQIEELKAAISREGEMNQERVSG